MEGARRGGHRTRPRHPRPSASEAPRTATLPHPAVRGRPGSYPPRPGRGDRRGAPGSAALCRRLQPLRGAGSIEPPKPAAGGNRRKVARVGGGAGTNPCPWTRRASRGGRSAAPSPGARGPVRCRHARARIPGDCAERLPSRGKLLLLGGECQMRGGPRPPPRSPRKVQCGGRLGLPSPGRRGRSAGEPLPFGLGGQEPRALTGRPGQENHREGRAGEAAGGFRTR